MISLIAAMAKNRAIGNQGEIPWKMPADLKHFKEMTLGKPIVMGRKTFDSIHNPLPGRRNIVISRQENLSLPCEVFTSLQDALDVLSDVPEVMIVGGGAIYKEALPIADRMYLTFIDVDVEGDAFFPQWNTQEWRETARENHVRDEKNPFNYSFVTFERGKI